MKKKLNVKRIAVMCVILFAGYNLLWAGWRFCRYHPYGKGMKVFRKHMSYVYTDQDGYLYNVKQPDYLIYSGNLCVAAPDESCALLIWPNIVKGYRYGAQVNKNNITYSIMLENDLNPRDMQYSDLISEYSDRIQELKNKAAKQWNI
ncbi:hypothetical protein [[Clostridium] polysaccharolyticum]|uniref:Uncharacterized protein n=1 Tax=[Clostridium] polysaccharolyticum TaxID=29364 RepID=A0A1I0FDT4_9FIRM|nr:hypothetical protein [[Clostridium] polysaccharolyticum]SET56110.1 hypothetical protein SAMN04487772_13026 [[Clostridium] polysaccharolyticum]